VPSKLAIIFISFLVALISLIIITSSIKAAPPLQTPSPTATPTTSTALSSPQVTILEDLILDHVPLLIDSEDGWLYTSGVVEGKPQTVVLSAIDGRLVRTYDITGRLELDPVHNWLYVDRGSQGVAVLEAQSGHLHTTISLPQQEDYRALRADPSSGQLFVSSGNIVYLTDPQTGVLIRSIPFNIPKQTCDGLTDNPSPINGIVSDSSRQLLYLSFASFGCTPWYFETVISFDLAISREIARADYSFARMTAFNGYLYGTDWYRFGIGYRWAWRDGRPWIHTGGWSGGTTNGFQVDSKRQRLYESVDGHLQVFDAQSMELLMAIPQPVAGELVGYDPKTDQLYFRTEGQLYLWPAGAIEPPLPQPLLAVPPPAEPADFLVVSPQWPEDKTLLGLWGYQSPSENCYTFGQSGGSLYISSDGGNTWGRPSRGLPANCDISTIALSPNYIEDQTILVGVEGWGLFRSTNGGQSWTPSNKGLSNVALHQVLLSPAFALDRTAFIRSNTELYRSNDGGQSWQALVVDKILDLVAMSPEFDQDHTLMGAEYGYKDNRPQTTVYLSHDGGYQWEQVGQPLDGTIVRLSLAPLFGKWHVVFAFSDNGTLYRSRY
jgi:hypothetical protein